MRRVLATLLFSFLVWLAVTWSLEPASLVVGFVASALVAAALVRLELPMATLLLVPRRLVWALAFIPVLFAAVVRANLDVAYRVLHPALPIRPGIVKVRTTLESPAGRVLLANAITLTPGTLSVDLVEDVLYVHRIHVPEVEPEEETRRGLLRFEGLIRRIFE